MKISLFFCFLTLLSYSHGENSEMAGRIAQQAALKHAFAAAKKLSLAAAVAAKEAGKQAAVQAANDAVRDLTNEITKHYVNAMEKKTMRQSMDETIPIAVYKAADTETAQAIRAGPTVMNAIKGVARDKDIVSELEPPSSKEMQPNQKDYHENSMAGRITQQVALKHAFAAARKLSLAAAVAAKEAGKQAAVQAARDAVQEITNEVPKHYVNAMEKKTMRQSMDETISIAVNKAAETETAQAIRGGPTVMNAIKGVVREVFGGAAFDA